MALNSVAPEQWDFTPQAEVDCWHGAFEGDGQTMQGEMLEEIAATIDYCFNIPDRDADVYSILTDAVRDAARYIASQPCSCTDEADCARCDALGRSHNERRAR